MNDKKKIAVVVIGRNEGDRLKSSLDSIIGKADYIVYVDSASSDGSADLARSSGIDTIELDNSQPYTAARSRNAGYARVREVLGDADYVQFVDGDCIVDSHWLDAASAFLSSRSDVAVVCGRLRERFPEKTIYNLLCDLEWDLPTGEINACGGNAFMRSEAFHQSNGFRQNLIAGEEPELCMRLRNSGWKIWRLADEMVLHDADMTKFAQWWTRSIRAGYTFAEGVHRLGRDCTRERNRALIWGLVLPSIILLGTVPVGPIALAAGLIYPLQVARLTYRGKFGFRNNLINACFDILGRFPEMIGVLKYYLRLATGKNTELIEYK